MIGETSRVMDAEKPISVFFKQYELPLNVKKRSWYGPFYFVVERIDNRGYAVGKRYRGNAYYDSYSCSVQELFYLYGENNKKIRTGVSDNSAQLIPSLNPNNLDLKMENYIKGITTLFAQRNNQLVPVTFDHFEEKNGNTVIYVAYKEEKSFYAFPSSRYLFSNKDDGNIAVTKANRRYKTIGAESPQMMDISKIVVAYTKLPEHRQPSKNWDEEFNYEKLYHGFVNEKLINDLIEPHRAIESSQEDLQRASDDYKRACIDARENGGIWDDHAYLSAQIRSDCAHRIIKSESIKIDRIESLRRKPYFARVDCGPTFDNIHTAYLGEQDIEGYVTSWRNPDIGNAYYHSSILQNRKDIVIALKRVIEIENANFITFEDEINQIIPISSIYKNEIEAPADDLLIRLLKLSRKDKTTHDIIRTIQSEQYDIITSDFERNTVINGCAGSGKTMIMYHRLSYMAYNYEHVTGKKFDPESVYVISPSEYFDFSNHTLLKKLSIESINHATLIKTSEKLIRKYCAKENLIAGYWLSDTGPEILQTDDAFFNRNTFERFYEEIESISLNSEEKALYYKWVINKVNQLLREAEMTELPEDEVINFAGNKSALLYSDDYYYNPCFNCGEKSKNPKEEQKRLLRLKNMIASISVENIQEAINLKKVGAKNTLYKERNLKLKKYSREKICSMALAINVRHDAGGKIFSELDGDGFGKLFDNQIKFKKMLTLVLIEKILDGVFSSNNNERDYVLKCAYVGAQVISDGHNKKGDCLLYYLAALTKKYGAVIQDRAFLFIDEFQNYSSFEIECIKDAFKNPTINLYGDFDQRIEEKGMLCSKNCKH